MIYKLPWDSDFFNLNVAKWSLERNRQLSVSEIDKYLKVYDLIYLVSKERIAFLDHKCADLKTTYIKNIELLKQPNKSARLDSTAFNESIHSREELLDIVLQSGTYSRFNLDEKIPREKFEALYTRWMEKGIKEKEGSKIYVVPNDLNGIDGFIQINIIANLKVNIELIAVAPHARGNGIASRLLKDSCSIARNYNIPILEVVTQDQNLAATRLYLKNSFNLRKKEYIYHLWK